MLNMDEKGSVTVINKNGSYLYLNADAGEASLVDENGNNVSMTDSGVTVTSKDGSIVDLGKDAVQVIAKNVHIRSQTVSLGEGAIEPAILGKTFAAIFDAHYPPDHGTGRTHESARSSPAAHAVVGAHESGDFTVREGEVMSLCQLPSLPLPKLVIPIPIPPIPSLPSLPKLPALPKLNLSLPSLPLPKLVIPIPIPPIPSLPSLPKMPALPKLNLSLPSLPLPKSV